MWKRKNERSQGERKGDTEKWTKEPVFRGNSVIVKRQKKHKILRRVEGQQPQNHVQCFFVVVPLVSSWSPIVFVYLVHCKSVAHLVFCTCGLCLSSFWWLCFVFCFHVCVYCALCFWFCCFSFLHFLFVWPKTRANHRISEMFVLMFRFGACILAVSVDPAKNPYSDQRWKWYLFHFYGS